MRQIILETRPSGKRAALLHNNVPIGFFQESNESIESIGALVVGRVLHYVPSLGLFVSLPSGKKGLVPEQEWPSKDVEPRLLKDLSAGELILLQVKRGPFQDKHAVMTRRNLQIIGDALIYLPYGHYVAVSKQIHPLKAVQLKSDLSQWVTFPEGVILRSKGIDRSAEELQIELAELRLKWDGLLQKALSFSSMKVVQPVSFFERLTTLLPSLKEREWWSNDRTAFKSLTTKGERVHFIEESELFASFGLNEAWRQLTESWVRLKKGLSLVIEKTEALTTIDVNTGSYIGKDSKGQTAFEGNLEILPELVRQIGLRQLSGIIIIDFLKMESLDHQREIEDQLTTLLKDDVASTYVAGFTKLGLLEMTRKDLGLTPQPMD